MVTTHPTPEQVAAARAAAGMTMEQAGLVVHRNNYRRWSEWERGVHPMPLAEWELFLLKTIAPDDHHNYTDDKVVDTTVNKQ